MPWVDVQQICLNGHQITDTYKHNPTTRKDYCTECGAKTITTCLNCGRNIPGETHYERVVDLSGITEPVPNICQFCGTKFPWADKKRKIVPTKMFNNISDIKIGGLVKIIGTIITTISIVLAIITDGFQVWDTFKPEKDKTIKPIINISIIPIRLDYSKAFSNENSIILNAKIETGNGIYRFIDSISIDPLKLIDSSYFFLGGYSPILKLEKATFDKMILGETKKEQEITLQLKRGFVLSGDKVFELYNLKSDKLIASAKVSFPYYFEGVKFSEIVQIPIFVYRE